MASLCFGASSTLYIFLFYSLFVLRNQILNSYREEEGADEEEERTKKKWRKKKLLFLYHFRFEIMFALLFHLHFNYHWNGTKQTNGKKIAFFRVVFLHSWFRLMEYLGDHSPFTNTLLVSLSLFFPQSPNTVCVCKHDRTGAVCEKLNESGVICGPTAAPVLNYGYNLLLLISYTIYCYSLRRVFFMGL